MCKARDIILINNYRHGNIELSRHSFIVINDECGTIQGLPYDFIGLVLSSFKDDAQKARKLSYPGNFPIANDDADILGGNKKDGYVKTDQYYYFDKSKIDYRVIGVLKEDVFDLLLDFIEESSIPLVPITDNL